MTRLAMVLKIPCQALFGRFSTSVKHISHFLEFTSFDQFSSM